MAGTNSNEKCSTCKYYRNEGAHLGVCKRFPNVINKHQNDFCGEWAELTVVENFAHLQEAMPELAEAAEGLMTISVEPKKRGRKPKNAETPSS